MARRASPAIHPLIVERWSPRAFDASEMPAEDLEAMLEAAIWAPSAFNFQPWRFVHARRGDAEWDRFVSLLIPFNAEWAAHASALVFILSAEMMGEGEKVKPSHSHSFDAGAAWAMMALQATHMGYRAHAMTGVDFEAAARELRVPAGYRVEAAVAIGKQTSPDHLAPALRDREGPSRRKPLSKVAFKGRFGG